MSPLTKALRRICRGRKNLLLLEADRTDAAIMLELAELRIEEDRIDEELRDPESSISQGLVYIAGKRPCPTATYLVDYSL